MLSWRLVRTSDLRTHCRLPASSKLFFPVATSIAYCHKLFRRKVGEVKVTRPAAEVFRPGTQVAASFSDLFFLFFWAFRSVHFELPHGPLHFEARGELQLLTTTFNRFIVEQSSCTKAVFIL